jgi:hypothetical protein
LGVTIAPATGGYSGEIRLGDQHFSLTSGPGGDHLAGTFVSNGHAFEFSATLQGDDLTLVSGGKTYLLKRQGNLRAGPPSNGTQPVAGQPGQPQAGQSDPSLAGYSVLHHTTFGLSVARMIPEAKTNTAALQATFPDVARFLGGAPTILKAYEDQRDHKSAFASFTGSLQGEPVKGFATTRLKEQGAVVVVVLARATATQAQWAELLERAVPAPGAKGGPGSPAVGRQDNGPQDIKAQMAAVPLRTYEFPDGTGSVGLADGWNTTAQTESNLLITGPAGQKIRMAIGGTFYTPNSALIRQGGARQNAAIAPYSDDPATALANIIGANSVVNQRNGGAALALERIVSVKPIPAAPGGGPGAQIVYDQANTDHGVVQHYRILFQFRLMPLSNLGAWGYYGQIYLMAPQETYERDLPVMMAQAWSLKEDAAAVGRKSAAEIAAANELARQKREAAQRLAEQRYGQTEAIERQSQERSQANADADRASTERLRIADDGDEVIRGIRTVQDTRTGQKTSVNLGDVDNVVDRLNEIDPGRYRQIPLRDESHPLPGQ